MHYKRKKARLNASVGKRDRWRDKKIEAVYRYTWIGANPAAWSIWNHTRPTRRHIKRLEIEALYDRRDADEVCWPNGRKPHIYYW